jgi:hypothetical protein
MAWANSDAERLLLFMQCRKQGAYQKYVCIHAMPQMHMLGKPPVSLVQGAVQVGPAFVHAEHSCSVPQSLLSSMNELQVWETPGHPNNAACVIKNTR